MSESGRFVWYELLTSDPKKAKKFYGSVVGWTTEPFGSGGNPYEMWKAGDTPIGGVMGITPETAAPDEKPHWWAHVAVDDVDASAKLAQKLGGSVRVPPTDIPEVGRFAIIADPQGAKIALFQPGGEPMEPPKPMTPGTVSWHELHTTDYEAAWKFYSKLFGWKPTSAMDMGEMGTYFMFGHPDDAKDASMGGMFNACGTTDQPPRWLYYVTVPAIDPALKHIKEGGGKVLFGPEDVPGGRIVQGEDPQGAMFAVFGAK